MGDENLIYRVILFKNSLGIFVAFFLFSLPMYVLRKIDISRLNK